MLTGTQARLVVFTDVTNSDFPAGPRHSASLCALQCAPPNPATNGQTLSPAWHVWIGMWQTTSQVSGEPVLVKPTNDSTQDEQLPSQVSGTSTTLLPHTAPKLSANMVSVSARAMPP